jgi:sulfane dehydrogenase subunit SoxC
MNSDLPKNVQSIAVPMSPDTFIRRAPTTPDQLVSEITPTKDVFVLAHMGVAQVNAATWCLQIDGMVDTPVSLTFPEILRLPKVEVRCFHQCAGFPKNSRVATRRIANVVWGGVSLAQVLTDLGPSPEAKYIWADGLDHGTYEDFEIDSYVKDIPLEKVPLQDLLLAYEINGEPLSAELGFPLRLVVPGFYGTNSVKWLQRIVLASTRAPGPFTNEFYNDPVSPITGVGATQPVWEAPPESVIVFPAPGARLSGHVEIWGRAWAYADVEKVELSMDDGVTWQRADLSKRVQHAWQTFRFTWMPAETGSFVLQVRATDCQGTVQPRSNARNSVHSVAVQVEKI